MKLGHWTHWTGQPQDPSTLAGKKFEICVPKKRIWQMFFVHTVDAGEI